MHNRCIRAYDFGTLCNVDSIAIALLTHELIVFLFPSEAIMLRHMDTSRSTYSHAKRDRTENGYEYLTNGQKFIWSKLGFLYLFVKPRKTNKKTPKKKPIVEQRVSIFILNDM